MQQLGSDTPLHSGTNFTPWSSAPTACASKDRCIQWAAPGRATEQGHPSKDRHLLSALHPLQGKEGLGRSHLPSAWCFTSFQSQGYPKKSQCHHSPWCSPTYEAQQCSPCSWAPWGKAAKDTRSRTNSPEKLWVIHVTWRGGFTKAR